MKLTPPCAACPYKLGLVKTLINPCPKCRLSGYKMFKEFTKQTDDTKKGKDIKGENK